MMDAGYSLAGWGAYLLVLLVGFLATEPWRWLGVLLAGRLSDDSEILIWVRSVATALVAGVIARLVLFPDGALAGLPLWLRLAAVGVGSLVFAATRMQVGLGILAAEVALIAGALMLGLPPA